MILPFGGLTFLCTSIWGTILLGCSMDMDTTTWYGMFEGCCCFLMLSSLLYEYRHLFIEHHNNIIPHMEVHRNINPPEGSIILQMEVYIQIFNINGSLNFPSIWGRLPFERSQLKIVHSIVCLHFSI